MIDDNILNALWSTIDDVEHKMHTASIEFAKVSRDHERAMLAHEDVIKQCYREIAKILKGE